MDEPIRITAYKGSVRLDEVHPKWALVGSHAGHCDYRAMKPYIDIVDSIKASEMSKMNFLG